MSEQSHGPQHDGGMLQGGPEGTHGESHAENQTLHVEKWEGIWMRVTTVMVVVFILAIVISATAFGISVPGVSGRVNPAELNNPENPFSQPGLRELAPGRYEAYMVSQIWSFTPAQIEVPVGSRVTFHITSRDVTHGFKIIGTNVNMMVLPGQISTLSATFDEPGTFDYVCHEYCGYTPNSPIGHHTMYGQITVVPTDTLTGTEVLTDTAVTDTAVTDTAALTETTPLTETTE